jgi:hypothetical protein
LTVGKKKWQLKIENYWNVVNFHVSSASMAQMDNGWNLDIGELAYSPSARDLSDAKVHHMLSEELWKPYRRVSLFSFVFIHVGESNAYLGTWFPCDDSEFPPAQLLTSRREWPRPVIVPSR